MQLRPAMRELSHAASAKESPIPAMGSLSGKLLRSSRRNFTGLEKPCFAVA
jgi:hypothetical protein